MYNRVKRVLIGDGANSVAASAVTLPTIKKGDLFLLKGDGSIVATNAAAALLPRFENVQIAQGIADGKFTLSSPIQGNTVSVYNAKKFVAPTEQITYVGYDAVADAGDIFVADNSEYELLIHYKDDRRIHGQRQTQDKFSYTTGDGATKLEAAYGILNIADDAREILPAGEGLVSVEVVAKGTYAALGASATLQVIKGSNLVIASAAGHGLVAGSYVRIGGAGATFPVYKVKAVNGVNITLSTTFIGASASLVPAGALTAITLVGFKLVGQEIPFNKVDEFTKVNFDASYGEGGLRDAVTSKAAPVTTVQAMSYGSGYWRTVYDQEFHAKGDLGINNRIKFPVIEGLYLTVQGVNYNTVVIEHAAVQGSSMEQINYNTPVSTVIYMASISAPPVSGEQANAANNDFVHILNGYFATKLGFDPITLA